MTVHLARKWRSKNFNELVGQELSVRLLKNSLFKKAFFPAYLFSGLRGSGKTSMGRIFAAAVNCQQLEAFRNDPRAVAVPCGTCVSCKALFAGRHPDFIEIDAASHTGVDNMRAIIESASLLPVMGNKKIYLIDEAHMLSKAAFNACLKILEEPPVHVMFILATTDPEKIIETIKSRCFQVFFDPIPVDILAAHLQHICDNEKITYDKQGLELLARQSGGSARDALTTLERIALAQGDLSAQSVQQALGLIQQTFIQQLLELIMRHDVAQLLAFIDQEKILSYASEIIWRSLTDLIRTNLYDQKIIKDTQVYQQLVNLLKISYETEPVLAKSSVPHAVIEFMLLRMCNPEPLDASSYGKTRGDRQKHEVPQEPKPARPIPLTTTPQGEAPWESFLAILQPGAESTKSVTRAPQPRTVPAQAQATRSTQSSSSSYAKASADKPKGEAPKSEALSQALKIFPGTIQEL